MCVCMCVCRCVRVCVRVCLLPGFDSMIYWYIRRHVNNGREKKANWSVVFVMQWKFTLCCFYRGKQLIKNRTTIFYLLIKIWFKKQFAVTSQLLCASKVRGVASEWKTVAIVALGLPLFQVMVACTRCYWCTALESRCIESRHLSVLFWRCADIVSISIVFFF